MYNGSSSLYQFCIPTKGLFYYSMSIVKSFLDKLQIFNIVKSFLDKLQIFNIRTNPKIADLIMENFRKKSMIKVIFTEGISFSCNRLRKSRFVFTFILGETKSNTKNLLCGPCLANQSRKMKCHFSNLIMRYVVINVSSALEALR